MVIERVDEPLGPILIRRPGGELSNTCDVQQLAVLWVEHDLFWEDADAMEEIASGSGQPSELFLSHDTSLLELSGLGGTRATYQRVPAGQRKSTAAPEFYFSNQLNCA